MRLLSIVPLLIEFVRLLLLAVSAAPQYDTTAFLASGYITDMSINNVSEPWSGGAMSFGGATVIIPENLYISFSELDTTSWSSMFNIDGTSKLLLLPETRWQVQVFATAIDGAYVAQIIHICREYGSRNRGFISHINYTSGELRINGDFNDPTTGSPVVINNSVLLVGRDSPEYHYPWTADMDHQNSNPGAPFPVCIPSIDPAIGPDPSCPTRDRTIGKFVTAFNFGIAPAQLSEYEPNPFVALAVGDFITYTSSLVPRRANKAHTLLPSRMGTCNQNNSSTAAAFHGSFALQQRGPVELAVIY